MVEKHGGQWKHRWSENGYVYEIRIHAGNPLYTNSKYIFRVARQSFGNGWSYLGLDRKWYSTSVLKEFFKNGVINPNFNEFAVIVTHLPI